MKGWLYLRRLFRFAGKYKIYLILAPLMVIGEVAMETYIPQLIARLVNLINEAEQTPLEMREILLLGGQMILMSILSLAFGAGAARMASIGAMGLRP